MATIYDMPDNKWAEVEWDSALVQSETRSPYTGSRQVDDNPWHGRVTLSAQHVPIVGEANVLAWRAFFARLNGRANLFRFPATEGNQHAGAQPVSTAGPIATLVGSGGMSVANGVAERTLAGGAWDQSAHSTNSGTAVSFVLGATGKNVMAGLNADASAGSGFADIDLAWYITPAGSPHVYVNGAFVFDSGVTPSVGQTGAIVIDPVTNEAVFYWNGLSYYAVTVSAATRYFDSSFFDPGGKLEQISIGSPGAGVRTIRLTGLPVSTTLLAAGRLMTLRLFDVGGIGPVEQLVTLTEALTSDSSGRAVATFEPPLRFTPILGVTVYTQAPWATVALTSPTPRRIVAGQQYGFSITAEEAW